VAGTIFNRIMLGFIIGISNLKIHYLIHGMFMGILVSLITSISFLESGIKGFIMLSLAGMIYGLLIELFATRIFRAPVR
jgi:hypothetical protein